MKYNKVFILSPTKTATGGTELLHQLSEKLLDRNVQAFIYYDDIYNGSAVEKRFSHYQKKIADSIEDSSENLIIVPETKIRSLYRYKHIQKAVWWLSVDFYPGSGRAKASVSRKVIRFLRDMRVRMSDKSWIHFVQSEYARLYLLNERMIPANHIFNLSDYISSVFFNGIQKVTQKDNIILYNPKKGYEFTKKIIERSPEFKWIPLINMTPDEMKKTMLSAKVYIDFGNHPGKDRIPREAALCGCCIITSLRGSAANNIDVMIPNSYKFKDEDSNISDIIDMIKQCFEKYEEKQLDFLDYISKIKSEEQRFTQDIEDFFLEGKVDG